MSQYFNLAQLRFTACFKATFQILKEENAFRNFLKNVLFAFYLVTYHLSGSHFFDSMRNKLGGDLVMGTNRINLYDLNQLTRSERTNEIKDSVSFYGLS